MLFSQRAGGFRGALPERNFIKKIGAGKIRGVENTWSRRSNEFRVCLTLKSFVLVSVSKTDGIHILNANMDEREDVGTY